MYGKIFGQIYDGTLASRGPWQALVTFEQLIVLSDKTGVVDMTAESIARRTTIPIEIIQVGLDALEQPDAESRTPGEEGRRIVRLSDDRPWGWRIVNHGHYRRLRTEEERREYHRLYQRKRRAAQKAPDAPSSSGCTPDVNKLTPCQPSQPIAVSSKQEAGSRKQTTTTTTSAGADAPRPLKARESWLTPLCEAHEAINGLHSFAPLAGQFAKWWKPLVDEYGGEKCAKHWTNSQTSEPKKDIPFRTPQKVASEFMRWAEKQYSAEVEREYEKIVREQKRDDALEGAA